MLMLFNFMTKLDPLLLIGRDCAEIMADGFVFPTNSILLISTLPKDVSDVSCRSIDPDLKLLQLFGIHCATQRQDFLCAMF